jgi:transcriptional regulator with XRE-family HTH domain
MELSERIVFLRESKGLKQYEIANDLGIEPPNYSRLEKRGDRLSIEQLKAIAAALGVNLNELLGLDAPVENEEKVKELEKRIEELEIQLSEKSEKLNDVEYIVNYYFDYFTGLAAMVHCFYQNNIIDADTNEILDTYSDVERELYFEQEQPEKDTDSNKYDGRNIKHESFLSDENKRALYEILLENESYEYSREIITLLSTGLIKDKIGKEFFPKLAFRKSQKPNI